MNTEGANHFPQGKQIFHCDIYECCSFLFKAKHAFWLWSLTAVKMPHLFQMASLHKTWARKSSVNFDKYPCRPPWFIWRKEWALDFSCWIDQSTGHQSPRWKSVHWVVMTIHDSRTPETEIQIFVQWFWVSNSGPRTSVHRMQVIWTFPG